ALRRVLDQIDDVIEIMRERQDVFAVDRRMERAIGADEDLPDDAVGLRFDRTNRRDVRGDIDAPRSYHVAELCGGIGDAFRLPAEELGEGLLRRHQTAEEVECHMIRLRWGSEPRPGRGEPPDLDATPPGAA